MENSNAHHAFLNDLLNSCYVASLYDSAVSTESLGALIVAAHRRILPVARVGTILSTDHAATHPAGKILDNTPKDALSDEIFDAVYIADQNNWVGEESPGDSIQIQAEIVESCVDAVLSEGLDLDTTFKRIDALPNAVPQAPAHIDFTNIADDTHGGKFTEPQPAARTYEETELELLKIAVSNPDLYNNLRQVFVEHKDPEKLDPVGKILRKFFIGNNTRT